MQAIGLVKGKPFNPEAARVDGAIARAKAGAGSACSASTEPFFNKTWVLNDVEEVM